MTPDHHPSIPGDLDDLRLRLEGHRPRRAVDPRSTGGWQAATALVVAPSDRGLALAVIERAERKADRWSGQMALPGGRRDPTDPDLISTARREAYEETGLALGDPLARLDDHRRRTRSGVVANFVFALHEAPTLRPDPREVADAWWLPLADVVSPERAVHHRYGGVPFPGIEHRGRVIWGLTRGTLDAFARALGTPLPTP